MWRLKLLILPLNIEIFKIKNEVLFLIQLHDNKDEELREKGRTCSETYSCVEDYLYFFELALPFVN